MEICPPMLLTFQGSPWGDLARQFGAVIRQFWPLAAIAFGVSLVATPLLRRIALAYGVVDRPDAFLKPHGKPIPYLGGLAIFLGWLAGIAAACIMTRIQVDTVLMLGIVAAGTIVVLVGLFDDLRVMPSTVKLGFNIIVALGLLALGLGDNVIQVFTHVMGVRFEESGRWLELLYSVPIVLFIVVGATNATNLIDGLDGLCSGVLAIIAAGFFVLAAHLRVFTHADIADERIILAAAMLGGALGFLPFNRTPAKIFMGDAGSMLLGLNAAILILLFADERMVRWMIGALMVFGLPVGDMLLTLVRRFRNGRPLMEGDRSHFYDQLRDRGLTVRQVVAISYVLTLAFVIAGTFVIFLRTRYAVLVYFMVVMLAVAAVWRFDMVSIERGPRRSAGSPGSDATPPQGDEL